MEIETSTEEAIQPVPIIGHPAEHLEIEENGTSEEIDYPTGYKLWLTVISLCLAMFLKGLVSSSNMLGTN
jgi:hypothetical protein